MANNNRGGDTPQDQLRRAAKRYVRLAAHQQRQAQQKSAVKYSWRDEFDMHWDNLFQLKQFLEKAVAERIAEQNGSDTKYVKKALAWLQAGMNNGPLAALSWVFPTKIQQKVMGAVRSMAAKYTPTDEANMHIQQMRDFVAFVERFEGAAHAGYMSVGEYSNIEKQARNALATAQQLKNISQNAGIEEYL